MPNQSGPRPLGDVLREVINNLGIRKELDAARTIEAWAILAGPQINGVTESAWIQGDRLYVKISSSTWRHELHLSRRIWRDRLNNQLGSELVSEIVFR